MPMRQWLYASCICLLFLQCSWSFLIKPAGLVHRRFSGLAAKFGDIHISEHLASSLARKGINTPSGIQITSLAHIHSGASCILHAATGTGKTLCFSLPIMSRLHQQQKEKRKQLQALVIVPTKELSIQVGADFSALEQAEEPIVQAFASGNSTKEEINRPVVVGTAYKVLDYLRSLNNTERVRDLLCGIETLVLDEVDRLIPTLGRYATYTEQRKASEFVNPTRDLLSLINKARASHQQSKSTNKGKSQMGQRLSPLQVIACSATVGRPLRRELCHAFSSDVATPVVNGKKSMSPSRFEGEFPIIRPPDAASSASLATASTAATAATPATELDKQGDRTVTRLVGIPEGIKHHVFVAQEDSRRGMTSLAKKLIPLKELWVSNNELVTGILFVPKTADVELAAAVLKAWGVFCLTDVTKLVSRDFSKRGALLKRPNKVKGKEITPPLSLTLAATDSEHATKSKAPRKALLILPLSSSRGLHIPDVDCVLLSQPPKNMDEYLHAAGRTGRLGSTHPGQGLVYTVVTPEQQRCLHSWQTPLGIHFEDA